MFIYYLNYIQPRHKALKVLETKISLLNDPVVGLMLLKKFRIEWEPSCDYTEEDIIREYLYYKQQQEVVEEYRKKYKSGLV